MAFINEARDGIVDVDSGVQFITLAASLLPRLAAGSRYGIILYNVTSGETATFEEDSYEYDLEINTSTLVH